MKVSEFTHLLQYPNEMVTASQTRQLDDVLQAYPYFQTARSLQLKGLKNLNSFKYNDSLKVTAAYTADRDVLFDFITSEEFLQNSIADTIPGKTAPITEQETISEDVLPNLKADTEMIEESKDEPLPRSLKDADQILDPSLFKSKDPAVDKKLAKEKRQKAEEDLQMGKPLPFTKKEKHSFGEWLQLTSIKPVSREENQGEESEFIADINFPIEDESSKKRKFELIDKFIESDPKIIPDPKAPNVDVESSAKLNKDELMTETLAKVYLEQKKYKKAIQSYRILSLKYPEKSSFFADRIKAVKQLQKENRK
ncbi:MAG: hypothetical protein ACR2MM_03360 [Flavobacteriaceae bacterium]